MADMAKSIKEQTDKELDALILRLRKEAEAQSLVQDMKRRSTPPVPYDPYNESNNVRDFSVSTEAPVNSLYHYGVKGMKWRHRKNKPKTTFSSVTPGKIDENTTLTTGPGDKKPLISTNYDPPETYKPKLEAMRYEGAGSGLTEAEKNGFKDENGFFFSGDYTTAKKKKYNFDILAGKIKAPSAKHSATDDEIDDFLEHFGILGMKWGVRRERGSDGRIIEGSRGSDDHQKARDLKKKGARNLSNSELKAYVERMNLEKQYSNLNKKEVSAGRKFVSDVLVTAGKTTLTSFVTKQMTTQLEKVVTKN